MSWSEKRKMPKPSPYVDLFLAALAEEPHTTAELAELADCGDRFAYAVCSRLRRPSKTLPQRIRVLRWVRHAMDDGTRGQYTPVWTLGDAPDAPKPKAQSHLAIARYNREKKRQERRKRIAEQRFKVSSVFELGSLVVPCNHKWKRAA